MAKASTTTYGNDSISMLKGAERVRKRPSVIFGSDGLEGCEHAVFEILSNAIDEAREGFGNIITVTRYEDKSIEVEDLGRGCPVDWNEKEQRYNWELIFCEMYAGGKYKNNEGENYEYSLGLNGLGACATQYASEYMDVTIWRDGKKYSLHFRQGEVVGGLESAPADRKKTGTTIRWRPDLEVFTDIDVPESYFQDVLHRQVRNGLLRLVLVGGDGRKAVRDQDQAVLHVLKVDLALALLILALLLDVGVDGGGEGALGRLFRRAAVLQPGRVVVVFDVVDAVGKAKRRRDLHLVFRLVRAVAAAPLALKELHRGQRRFACQLADIVHDAVLVQKFGGVEFAAAHLIFQHEFDVAVDDCLTLERIEVVIHRDVDVGENLKVGLPSDRRAGLSGVRRLFREAFLCAGPVFALFEVQAVLEAVAHDGDVHVFRGILRRAGAETVQAERKLIVFACVVLVLT